MARGSQAGLTLVETIVAVAILGIAILMAAAVVIWAVRVDTRAQERALALDLAASVAERVRATPYESVASGELDAGTLVPGTLTDVRVALEVDEDPAQAVKDVQVKVSWGGQHPSRLVLETAVGARGAYE